MFGSCSSSLYISSPRHGPARTSRGGGPTRCALNQRGREEQHPLTSATGAPSADSASPYICMMLVVQRLAMSFSVTPASGAWTRLRSPNRQTKRQRASGSSRHLCSETDGSKSCKHKTPSSTNGGLHTTNTRRHGIP